MAGVMKDPAPDEHRLVEQFAHDLRAPLISVLGYSDVLREQLGDAATRERAAEAIGRNARRLERVIDELVETSAVLAGRARVDPGPLDLAELVAAAVGEAAADAAAHGVEVRLVSPAHGLAGRGDRRHLARVVRSVLAEAIESCTPRGAVTVDVVADEGEPGAPHVAAVAVMVRSTRAAPTARLPPLAPAAGARELGRAALARIVVARLVELHGGSIRAEATASGDARTVVVTLPLHHDGA